MVEQESDQAGAEQVVRNFRKLYFDQGWNEHATWARTYWMGAKVLKCPTDLWVYQELLYYFRPQRIVECGTRHGGSALFLCHMLDLIGVEGARVVTIDITPPAKPPQHPRLTYLTGSSTDPQIVQQVRDFTGGASPVMVILDSDHARDHVLAEMRAYHELVTPGSFLIVEDTIVNHPVLPEHGPGPMEAVELFMQENHDFEFDRVCEKFLLTFNASGYLRKRGGPTPPPRLTQ